MAEDERSKKGGIQTPSLFIRLLKDDLARIYMSGVDCPVECYAGRLSETDEMVYPCSF
jgi:hypothetical protein